MRAARLDPSALSPSEHEAYEAWVADLEAHLGRLQRGLRIGEMLAFIRKRTVVDREAEVRLLLLSSWNIRRLMCCLLCIRSVAVIAIIDYGLLWQRKPAAELGHRAVLGYPAARELKLAVRKLGPSCALIAIRGRMPNIAKASSFRDGMIAEVLIRRYMTQLAHARTCSTLTRDHIFIQVRLADPMFRTAWLMY